MYFANPWGLLTLASLPIIAYIHIFHRRYPPLEIAGLHLWGLEVNRQAPGRKKERLPISRTLLLELLAALLMSLLVSQPRFGEPEKVPHLVVILDNSASMSAKASKDQVPFRDAAISTLKGRLESLGKKAVVTVLLSGRRPVMLAGPGIPLKEAQQALDLWQPTSGKHEFYSAWDLATQLKTEATTLLFLTDTPLKKEVADSMSQDIEVIALGEKLPNLAFTAGGWTLGKPNEPGQLFARLANLGPKESEVTLTVSSKIQQKPLSTKTFKIPSRLEEIIQIPVLPGTGNVTLKLDSKDDPLSVDSTLELVEPERRLLKVAVALPVDHSATKPLVKVLKFINNWESASVETADLIFGPAGSAPNSKPNCWWIGVGPLAAGGTSKPEDYLGPYILEKRNPLVEGLSLGGVVWGGVQPTTTNVTPIISVGSNPVFMQLRGLTSRAYLMNIDLARSNITESPDWPILVSNLIEECRRNQPGLQQANYRQDQQIFFGLAPEILNDDKAELELLFQGTKRPLAKTRIVELPPQEKPGVYEIKHGETLVGTFAINFFDREESELSGLGDAHRDVAIAGSKQALLVDDPFTIWIMIGMVLIVGVIISDWFVLKPKNLVTSS
jgi:hypothetical protein